MTDDLPHTTIPCPECRHEVSPRAAACPQCGFPVARFVEAGRRAVSPHGTPAADGAVPSAPERARDGGLSVGQIAVLIVSILSVLAIMVVLARGGDRTVATVTPQGEVEDWVDFETPTAGAFTLVRRDSDEGENRSLAYVEAEVEGRMVWLGWACLADGLNVLIGIGKYFGGDADGDIAVRYRFDGTGEFVLTWWTLFEDHELAWLRMDLVPSFTVAARQARTLEAVVTDPLDDETFRVAFPLGGLTGALTQLDDCR